MSYKKRTVVEKQGLKTRHRSERDQRICDRIKAVLLYDNGYRLSIDIRDFAFER